MSLRRLTPLVLAFGLWGCPPTVPYTPPPAYVDYVVFDLESSPPSIPQPNDLTLQFAAGVPGAQGELLRQFVANGGFPYDQEVPVTVDFTRTSIDAATGSTTGSAPPLDIGSITVCTSPATPCNLLVLRIDTLQPGPAPIEAAATTYAAGSTKGTLTVHNVKDPATGSRRWAAGAHYLVAVRGGPEGVLTTGGGAIYPEAAFSLLLQGKDLSDPANSTLLPPGLGSQLELLRQNYLPAFAAVDNFFPSTDLAVLTTFQIAPATAWVLADPGAGQVPLPSDFLRNPATGFVMNIPAFGPLAPGLATLDGFSTTAMLLAPTSGPVLASSVAPTNPADQSVFLYEYQPTGPVLVNDLFRALETSGAPNYLAEPPVITHDTVTGQPCASPPYALTCVSTVIGLQPAVPASTPGGFVGFPPLKENTEYAVVITKRVKTATSTPAALSPSTLGQILLLTSPLCTPSPACTNGSGTSLLAGVSNAEAGGLEAMRLGLQPVTARLQADAGLTKADIAFAYTFRTQTISGTYATTSHGGTANSVPGAVQISAIPYTALLPGVCAALGTAIGNPSLDCTKPLPSPFAFNTYTATGAPGSNVTDAFAKYGVDLSVPHGNIDTIYEFQIATVNKLSAGNGAFDPNPAGAKPEVLTVLLAVGAQPAVPTCTGPLAPFDAAGFRCAPLVVFQHGITTSKAYVLSVADELVAAGNVVAGVDLVWHGDRTYCNAGHDATNPNVECAGGSICVPDPALAGQALPPGQGPGKCRAGTSFGDPAAPFVNQAAVCTNPGTVGVPGSSCAFVPGVSFPITLDPASGIPSNQGYPAASGEFLVSANFFRTRDSLRQSLIDHTQLLQVVAPTPQAGPIAGNDLYNALLAKGILVSPFGSSLVGQSLGSMVGALSAAANPRFSKAVFNAGGGTLVDVFTTAPASQADVDALFLSIGIDRTQIATDPAVAAEYLQTINVLKWVLDPADPVNATGHLGGATWPNLLPPLGGNTDGSVAQAAKPVLAQAALCDQRVPNPFNALFAATAGLSPTLPPAAPPGPTGTMQWFVNTSGPSFPASQVYPLGCASGVSHDFFAGWGTGITDATRLSKEQGLTDAAQASSAAFLASPAPLTPTLVVR